jgi:hypothetical protein
MLLSQLTVETAASAAVETLGLDPAAVDLASTEAVAASLRRAASFLCPTSPGRLVDAVKGAIQPLGTDEVSRADVFDILEQLVAAGDLLELRHDSGRSTRLLYLAPPSFIERQPSSYLLMGIRPFGVPLIDDDLADAIDYEGHTRSITLDPGEGPEQLRERGLHAVDKKQWVSRPAVEAPADLIARYQVRLDVAGEAGQLEGLQLLDPDSSVRYYARRWRSPAATDTGDFIARRPQAYGADLWCLTRFHAGEPQRLIELPVNDPVVPGCDEAWRYQAAADAERGAGQRFRLRTSGAPGDDVTFDFFSPLPGFAERYLQLAGLALGKTPGALFSFRLPIGATGDAAAFLTDMLWMAQEEAPSGV